MSEAGYVTIKIFDMLGQEVRTLINEEQPAGNYSVVWDGLDANGSRVTTGAYLYRAVVGDRVEVRKMVLLK